MCTQVCTCGLPPSERGSRKRSWGLAGNLLLTARALRRRRGSRRLCTLIEHGAGFASYDSRARAIAHGSRAPEHGEWEGRARRGAMGDVLRAASRLQRGELLAGKRTGHAVGAEAAEHPCRTGW